MRKVTSAIVAAAFLFNSVFANAEDLDGFLRLAGYACKTEKKTATLSPGVGLAIARQRMLDSCSLIAEDRAAGYIREQVEDAGGIEKMDRRSDIVKSPDGKLVDVNIVPIDGLLRERGITNHLENGERPVIYVDRSNFYEEAGLRKLKNQIVEAKMGTDTFSPEGEEVEKVSVPILLREDKGVDKGSGDNGVEKVEEDVSRPIFLRTSKIAAILAATFTLSYFASDVYMSILNNSAAGTLLLYIGIGAYSRAAGMYINQNVRGQQVSWEPIFRWASAGGIYLGIVVFGVWYSALSLYVPSTLWRVVLDITAYAAVVGIPANIIIQKYYVFRDTWKPSIRTMARDVAGFYRTEFSKFIRIFIFNAAWWATGLSVAWECFPDYAPLIAANMGVVWSGILIYMIDTFFASGRAPVRSFADMLSNIQKSGQSFSITVPFTGADKKESLPGILSVLKALDTIASKMGQNVRIFIAADSDSVEERILADADLRALRTAIQRDRVEVYKDSRAVYNRVSERLASDIDGFAADILLKGNMPTDDMMPFVIKSLRNGGDLLTHHRVFPPDPSKGVTEWSIWSDGGLGANINESLKLAMIKNGRSFMRYVGVNDPAGEVINEYREDFDAAASMYENVVVFPGIDSANIGYKVRALELPWKIEFKDEKKIEGRGSLVVYERKDNDGKRLNDLIIATPVAGADLTAKRNILDAALMLSRESGVTSPKAALLSFTERPVEKFLKMPSMRDTLSLRDAYLNRADCTVEGPFSYDLAILKKSRDIKLAGNGDDRKSIVAGDPDILFMPDAVSGAMANEMYKHWSGRMLPHEAADIVLGGRKVALIPSRADWSRQKVNGLVSGMFVTMMQRRSRSSPGSSRIIAGVVAAAMPFFLGSAAAGPVAGISGYACAAIAAWLGVCGFMALGAAVGDSGTEPASGELLISLPDKNMLGSLKEQVGGRSGAINDDFNTKGAQTRLFLTVPPFVSDKDLNDLRELGFSDAPIVTGNGGLASLIKQNKCRVTKLSFCSVRVDFEKSVTLFGHNFSSIILERNGPFTRGFETNFVKLKNGDTVLNDKGFNALLTDINNETLRPPIFLSLSGKDSIRLFTEYAADLLGIVLKSGSLISDEEYLERSSQAEAQKRATEAQRLAAEKEERAERARRSSAEQDRLEAKIKAEKKSRSEANAAAKKLDVISCINEMLEPGFFERASLYRVIAITHVFQDFFNLHKKDAESQAYKLAVKLTKTDWGDVIVSEHAISSVVDSDVHASPGKSGVNITQELTEKGKEDAKALIGYPSGRVAATMLRILAAGEIDQSSILSQKVAFTDDWDSPDGYIDKMKLLFWKDGINDYSNIREWESVGFKCSDDYLKKDAHAGIALKSFLALRQTGAEPTIRSFPELAAHISSGNLRSIEYVNPSEGNPPALVLNFIKPLSDVRCYSRNNFKTEYSSLTVFVLNQCWGERPSDYSSYPDGERKYVQFDEDAVKGIIFDEGASAEERLDKEAKIFSMAVDGLLVVRCPYCIRSMAGAMRAAEIYGRTDKEKDAIYRQFVLDISPIAVTDEKKQSTLPATNDARDKLRSKYDKRLDTARGMKSLFAVNGMDEKMVFDDAVTKRALKLGLTRKDYFKYPVFMPILKLILEKDTRGFIVDDDSARSVISGMDAIKRSLDIISEYFEKDAKSYFNEKERLYCAALLNERILFSIIQPSGLSTMFAEMLGLEKDAFEIILSPNTRETEEAPDEADVTGRKKAFWKSAIEVLSKDTIENMQIFALGLSDDEAKLLRARSLEAIVKDGVYDLHLSGANPDAVLLRQELERTARFVKAILAYKEADALRCDLANGPSPYDAAIEARRLAQDGKYDDASAAIARCRQLFKNDADALCALEKLNSLIEDAAIPEEDRSSYDNVKTAHTLLTDKKYNEIRVDSNSHVLVEFLETIIGKRSQPFNSSKIEKMCAFIDKRLLKNDVVGKHARGFYEQVRDLAKKSLMNIAGGRRPQAPDRNLAMYAPSLVPGIKRTLRDNPDPTGNFEVFDLSALGSFWRDESGAIGVPDGGYRNFKDFGGRYKVKPDNSASAITIDEAISHEIGSAVSAYNRIVSLRSQMDGAGRRSQPLIVWQNARLGGMYPYFTTNAMKKLGMAACSVEDMRRYNAGDSAVPEDIANARYILISGQAKLSSNNIPREDKVFFDIESFAIKLRAPVIMVDNAKNKFSGAQSYIINGLKNRSRITVTEAGEGALPSGQEPFMMLFNANIKRLDHSRVIPSDKLVSDFDDMLSVFGPTDETVTIGGISHSLPDAFRTYYGSVIDATFCAAVDKLRDAYDINDLSWGDFQSILSMKDIRCSEIPTVNDLPDVYRVIVPGINITLAFDIYRHVHTDQYSMSVRKVDGDDNTIGEQKIHEAKDINSDEGEVIRNMSRLLRAAAEISDDNDEAEDRWNKVIEARGRLSGQDEVLDWEYGIAKESPADTIKSIIDRCGIGAGKSVLDVGTGIKGTSAALFAATGARVHTVEINPAYERDIINNLNLLRTAAGIRPEMLTFEIADVCSSDVSGYDLVYFFFTYPINPDKEDPFGANLALRFLRQMESMKTGAFLVIKAVPSGVDTNPEVNKYFDIVDKTGNMLTLRRNNECYTGNAIKAADALGALRELRDDDSLLSKAVSGPGISIADAAAEPLYNAGVLKVTVSRQNAYSGSKKSYALADMMIDRDMERVKARINLAAHRIEKGDKPDPEIIRMRITGYESSRTKEKELSYSIKIWKGYASAGQEGLLTQIRKATEGKRYEVKFVDPDEMRSDTCDGERQAVYIIPAGQLPADSIKELKDKRAMAIFIDTGKNGASIFTQADLPGIIGLGKAYLNDDEDSFYRLYRLLAKEPVNAIIPLSELKADPMLFVDRLNFILRPITARDITELNRINSCMKELLQYA